MQRVQLLRGNPGDWGGLVLREARLHAHLGAARSLALADPLGNVLNERLGLEGGLVENDFPDHVIDDFLEARHVRALLLGAEVDNAFEAS